MGQDASHGLATRSPTSSLRMELPSSDVFRPESMKSTQPSIPLSYFESMEACGRSTNISKRRQNPLQTKDAVTSHGIENGMAGIDWSTFESSLHSF